MIQKSSISIDITMKKAKVDSMREEVEALIKIMQEAIDSLLDGLSGIAKDASDVTALLDDFYRKQSAALTQLTQA